MSYTIKYISLIIYISMFFHTYYISQKMILIKISKSDSHAVTSDHATEQES